MSDLAAFLRDSEKQCAEPAQTADTPEGVRERLAAEWKRHYARAVAAGRCPFSGETIRRCKAADLCDCYNFPEAEK